jgi:uncharacterized protein
MASEPPPGAVPKKQSRCPICGAPTQHETRPFCSRRCRDVDLGRWLSGGYAISGGNADADEDGESLPEMSSAPSENAGNSSASGGEDED